MGCCFSNPESLPPARPWVRDAQLHPLCCLGQVQGVIRIVIIAAFGWSSLLWPGSLSAGHWATSVWRSPGAREQTEAKADQAEPWRNAGLISRRDGTREKGVKETPVRGRTFQVKEGHIFVPHFLTQTSFYCCQQQSPNIAAEEKNCIAFCLLQASSTVTGGM
nr:uncharacterized protein LOC105881007 [Microcebus murinus]